MTKDLDQAGLGPLRTKLIALAQRDADAEVATARAEAGAHVAAAKTAVDKLIADARERGRADAAQVLAAEGSRVQRHARGLLLQAQRSLYDELSRLAHDGVRMLRHDPCYAQLCAAVEERARSLVGPDAVVREHRDGGSVIEGPGRRVDASLDVLADWAIDSLGAEVARVWTL